MCIISKTFYLVDGEMFDSEEKARAWVYDQIGTMLDSCLTQVSAPVLDPKERLKIVEALTLDPKELARLLNLYASKVSECDY